MKFDADVAASAQAWAENMASKKKMYHSTNEERPGCGENLAWNTRTNFGTTNMASQ